MTENRSFLEFFLDTTLLTLLKRITPLGLSMYSSTLLSSLNPDQDIKYEKVILLEDVEGCINILSSIPPS